jgi:hypothetical protein
MDSIKNSPTPSSKRKATQTHLLTYIRKLLPSSESFCFDFLLSQKFSSKNCQKEEKYFKKRIVLVVVCPRENQGCQIFFT